MRKLADYAFMLRDYKLAHSTYDLLRSDYNNDKAWKYYAGAHEMAAIAALMYQNSSMSAKARAETVDQLLETAAYSYLNRCAAPYNALRTLALGVELLRMRGGSATDDAARWAGRVLEMRLVGSVGQAVLYERVAACYAARAGVGSMAWGARRRKAAFWAALAADEWLALDKSTQAEKNLHMACHFYGSVPDDGAEERDEGKNGLDEPVEWTNEIKAEPPPQRSLSLPFGGMQSFVEELKQNVAARRQAALAAQGYDVSGDDLIDISDHLGEPVVEEVVQEDLGATGRAHRKSLSVLAATGGVNFEEPLSPLMERKREILAENSEDDGFN
jgi:trafficking protein particle complex subunit 8